MICVETEKEAPVAPYFCDPDRRLEIEVRTCNENPCPPRWNVSGDNTRLSLVNTPNTGLSLVRLTEGPVLLVGSSLGGWLSLLVAREMEERLHSLGMNKQILTHTTINTGCPRKKDLLPTTTAW